VSSIYDLAKFIPSVTKPLQKLSFKEKAQWSLIILGLFFLLSSITVVGINQAAVAQFEFLEIVFGSKFGSIITLGIGPIVTASIILQLMVGSKIIPWDLKNSDDKKKFSASQKLLTVAFSFIEAVAYVLSGAVPPVSPDIFNVALVILQLAAGGIIILFMDEVVSKWGFGSGVSLFIAAGVSKTIFLRIFSPPIGTIEGGLLAAFFANLNQGLLSSAFVSLLPLISTIVVFILAVYAQDVKVEIPMAFSLPFGKFASRRWPLKFLYTSNIPVILMGAVLANLQVFGRLLDQRGFSILGNYDQNGVPISGIMLFLTSPSSSQQAGAVSLIIVTVLAAVIGLMFALLAIRLWKKYAVRMALLGGMIGLFLGFILVVNYNLPPITNTEILQSISYMLVFIIGSVIFSLFWVNTAGMDSKSVAGQFESASIIIPGFRHDPRIVERVLDRYIPALTILGGAFVGFLAAFADLTAAIGTGTGILLTVMIIYQLYEQISSQHYQDIHPAVRKFIGE